MTEKDKIKNEAEYNIINQDQLKFDDMIQKDKIILSEDEISMKLSNLSYWNSDFMVESQLKTIIFDIGKYTQNSGFCTWGWNEEWCCTEFSSSGQSSPNCSCCCVKNITIINQPALSYPNPSVDVQAVELDINNVEISSRFNDMPSVKLPSSISQLLSLKRNLFRCFTAFFKSLLTPYIK